ncbi:MAG: Acyl-coenzyme A:6-aminopenicillanic acid acyl-transferase [Syntrophaceae bacterium PtaB.Bin038]|nr:MAG: Acyl-coenzyme A:6-aminopenicillanic acid acyl-transferase [Syntrophaceae bacterium PtaB.Bin038]
MKKETRLNIVECGGSPYEIGRQWGEGCRESLKASLGMLYAGLEHGPFKAGKAKVWDAAVTFMAALRNFDPYGFEVLRGQAEGAGVVLEEALALQCSVEIAFNYGRIMGLCTSFAAAGRATAGGRAILGQNVDWHPAATIDLLRIRHDSGVREFVLCLSGSPYYHLNSAGVGNCVNLTLGPLGDMKQQVPLSVTLSRAMRQPRIGFALGILRRQARGLGYVLLAESSGGMTGLEAVADDIEFVLPERDVLVHANHYETQRFRAGDWTPQLIPDTTARAGRMRERIDDVYGSITPETMMGILSDHEGHPNSICRHVDPSKPPELASASRASFVMVPAEGRMYIAAGPPCEYEFMEYRL